MPSRLAPPRARAPRLTALVAAACSLALAGTLAQPVTAHAYDDPTTIDGMVLDGAGAYVVDDVEHTELAPGLDQVEFERFGPGGRQLLHVLRVQLADSNLEVDYIGNDAVTAPGTVSEFVDGSGAIAGVNGDFFDINNSSAPLGTAISRDGGLLKSAEASRNNVAGFTESGLGGVVEVFLEGTVTLPSGSLRLAGINRVTGEADSVIVYNDHWGTGNRARSIPAGQTGVEVLIGADGTVTRTAQAPGSELLDAGVQAVVAAPGATADALTALAFGDEVSVDYTLNPEAVDLAAGVGGHASSEPLMLEDGVVGEAVSDLSRLRHPRTGVGFSADGTTAYFVVADGRQSTVPGLTVPELGQFMRDLGASDALNLDGGGSSQMNARQPGATGASVLNAPSDGYERRDANGLGIFLRTPGSSIPARFDLRTAIDHDDADRVFPGLHRRIDAVGVTENGSAADAVAPTWTTTGGATVAADGSSATVTGVTPGAATVAATHGAATGERTLQVLGPLTRVTASSGLVALNGRDDSRILTLIGHDADGFQSPIDPADVEIAGADASLLSFTPHADGTFEVRALGELGSASPTFTVAGLSTTVPITVGLNEILFADLADAAQWTSANDRAPGGSVSPAPGHEGDNGLTLRYDFTQSTATRGQYAVAPNGGVVLPGQPQKLTMWIEGDGNGAWPRLQFRQANGTTSNLDGPEVTWTGWRQAEFSVPAGVQYPLTFQRFRLMETKAGAQYTGQITISSLAVAVAPDVDMPATEVVPDPVIVADGATDDAPLRVAVMSDAQFVARAPESEAVAGARRALREIVAAAPDVLVINGDFVDEASPADFALAKSILDEELAGVDFPWYYVPGNHEIMGGDIANFQQAFGANFRTVDQQGTRLIMLDTSTGSISGKVEQLEMLRDALAGAQSDSAVTGVVLLQHHPLDDPLPTKSSQLGNRDDAALVRDWLERFRETSGKSAAFVGSHVGVFHATREDGIPYLINGNSGKAPAGSPFGQFTGWTMLGIDPAAGQWADAAAPWLEAEVQTRVDAIAFDEIPQTLEAGTRTALAPTISQPGHAEVSVAWPMSYRWTASSGVHIGAAADAPAGTIAALDPTTHVLTALAPGAGSVSLTLNGVTETVPFATAGGVVVIDGDALQGETLTGRLDDWSAPEGATVEYQWLRDGEPIDTATTSEYTVQTADEGHRLSLRVVVRTEGLDPLTFTSAETALVPPLGALPPRLTVSESSVHPGDEIVVRGSGYTGGAEVEVWLHSAPVLLGTATAAADGSFALTTTVPLDTAAGTHALRATDPVTGLEATVSLSVLVDTPGGGDGGDGDGGEGEGGDGSGDELGVTGGEVAPWIVLSGLLLLLVGAGLVGMRVRRRAADAPDATIDELV